MTNSPQASQISTFCPKKTTDVDPEALGCFCVKYLVTASDLIIRDTPLSLFWCSRDLAWAS